MKTRNTDTRRHLPSRRAILAGGALAGGGLILRSLATGLPPLFLADPARAQLPGVLPQTLIMATSQAGDPVNANCPGSYVAGAEHPDAFAQPVPIQLGQTRSECAAPWLDLPAALRERLSVFHYASRSPAHSDHKKTLRMHGSVRGADGSGTEEFPAMVAQLVGPILQTQQAEPLPLSNAEVGYEGQPLQTLAPSQLAALFDRDAELQALADLRSMRDRTLDAVYGRLRRDGNRSQRAFVERYLRSRDEARNLGEQLAEALAGLGIDSASVAAGAIPADEIDGAQHQLITAVALASLGIAPVITVSIPFGGDNHQDGDLADETAETISGVGQIAALWGALEQTRMTDRVTFALLNVFGRTLVRNAVGGRNHNRDHAVMISFGPGINPGVYGGVEVVDGRARCLEIDRRNGTPAGDGLAAGRRITRELTMESAGKTLALAMGLDSAAVEARLPLGMPVQAMLRDA